MTNWTKRGTTGETATFPKLEDVKKGTVYEGELVRIGKSKEYGNPIYFIRTKDMGLVGLMGTGALKSSENGLGGLPAGTLVRVTYQGMQKIENGKYKNKKYHAFDVEYDLSTVRNNGTTAATEEVDGTEDNDDSELPF